jgi:hypothetical protein
LHSIHWFCQVAKSGKQEATVLSIEFKVSSDPQLLAQYYALREQCFRRELELPDFDGSEEEADRRGRILLAIEGGRCIAGVRISPSVVLQSQVQQLGLKKDACCMWERFVFEPSVRSVNLIREFIGHLIEVSRDTGYYHAMVLSSLRNARFYRRCHSALGVGYQIHRHVPHSAQGAFAGLEHYLSISQLVAAQPMMAAPMLAAPLAAAEMRG